MRKRRFLLLAGVDLAGFHQAVDRKSRLDKQTVFDRALVIDGHGWTTDGILTDLAQWLT